VVSCQRVCVCHRKVIPRGLTRVTGVGRAESAAR
jgi:hypothetical protein